MNRDYAELLAALIAKNVRFMVVGAHAVAVHGYPRGTVDILTGVSGLTFAAAWTRRIEAPVEGVPAPVLGRADLIDNKKASGRLKDLADLKGLEGRS